MSSPAPDLSRWLSKDQAAAQMGVSLRSLERRMEAGTIPYTKHKGRVVISPETVAQADRPPVAAVPATVPPVAPQSAEVAKVEKEPPVTRAEMMALMSRVQIAESNPRRWMKLTSAAEICGLSPGFLRRLIREGKLEHVIDRQYKVRRDTLDELAGTTKKRGRK